MIEILGVRGIFRNGTEHLFVFARGESLVQTVLEVDMSDQKTCSPPESAPLTEDERAAVEALQKEFEEELSHELLVRFVRGYWKEENRHQHTVDVLKRSLDWRKERGVDGIENRFLEKEDLFYEQWPQDFHGVSKLGHPVYYEKTATIDPSTLLENFTMEELELHHAQMQETLLEMKRDMTKKSGKLTYKSIVIMDMADFGSKHLSSKFSTPIKTIIHIDQYYYPETLQKLLLINCPFVFRMMWAMIKPWLHPITRSRIEILGSGYLPKLQEICEDDQIPVYLGGKCTCCENVPLEKQMKKRLECIRKKRQERIDTLKQ